MSPVCNIENGTKIKLKNSGFRSERQCKMALAEDNMKKTLKC